MDIGFSFFSNSSLPLFNHIVLLAINFIAISLTIMVLVENGIKEVKSLFFFLMSILILTWVDCAYIARIVGESNMYLAELFLRIAWVATPLLFFITYLTATFIVTKRKMFHFLDLSLFVLSLVLAFGSMFTDLIISTISFDGDHNLDIVYGRAFIPFLLIIVVFMVATLYPLIKTKFTEDTKFFFIGVMVFYIFNAIFNITLPFFFHVTHLYYFGDYSTIFLLSFTLYAIFQHGFLDVKVFSTELLTIVLWSLLLARVLVFKTVQGLIIDLAVLIFSFFFGYLLVKSVRQEIEQKELLGQMTRKLRDLDEQKDEFLNVAAHELRAPMTAIKGYLSMISDGDAGKVSKKLSEFLGEAENENDRLIRLVNNLLNISRIEEGRMVFEMGEVKLSKVVKDSFNSFKAQASEKNLEFKLKIEDNIKDTVHVDTDRIYEVVNNLISNAVKYTDSGFVKVSLENKENNIYFEVSDSGYGMNDDEKEKMFQKFYRAESSINKQIGTGLGLYISKLLVEKFNGRIGFSSEKDKGSVFWFELPVV